MMSYTIHRLPRDAGAYPLEGAFPPEALRAPYDQLEVARIDCYPWSDGAYEPEARAYAGWNEEGLHLLLCAREETIRAAETRTGGKVCEDSCLEFFFQPFPQADARYLNIEVNPIGTVHMGLGEGRANRRVWTALPGGFSVRHSAHDNEWWAVAYTVPAAFLAELFEGRTLAEGQRLRGNFYACDESLHPHFGCWSPVRAPRPDFHRPECFGDLVLR